MSHPLVLACPTDGCSDDMTIIGIAGGLPLYLCQDGCRWTFIRQEDGELVQHLYLPELSNQQRLERLDELISECENAAESSGPEILDELRNMRTSLLNDMGT